MSEQVRGDPGTGPRQTFSRRKRNMSSPILPTESPQGSPPPTPSAPGGGSGGVAFESELRAHEQVLAGADEAPPPEVLEEIAAAGRTNEELRAAGRQVRFIQDESQNITIELRGPQGELLRTLSVAEALDLAAGKPLS
jgi:hypothetical protein